MARMPLFVPVWSGCGELDVLAVRPALLMMLLWGCSAIIKDRLCADFTTVAQVGALVSR
jgi:hypothetical protein